METIINVSPSELNIKLLKKIKDFIGNKQNVDVTISLKRWILHIWNPLITPFNRRMTSAT